ncbi:SUKH-4 family immunity protein [Streptomyces hydrogenans]|uniref:SUKH-4 family immunity protein n=1 Tax=Streptomyces hydrogenans TaxID=1873719 RepID=UPI0035E04FB8
MSETNQDPDVLAAHLAAAHRALTADLAELAVPAKAMLFHAPNTGERLQQILAPLARWGVPEIENFGFTTESHGTLVKEADSPGDSFLRIGTYWRWGIAVTGQGEVRGLQLDEWPEVFVNSSIEAFVETSWRWYYTWLEAEQMGWHIECFDVVDNFLEYAIAKDPRVGLEERSLWKMVVESWSG